MKKIEELYEEKKDLLSKYIKYQKEDIEEEYFRTLNKLNKEIINHPDYLDTKGHLTLLAKVTNGTKLLQPARTLFNWIRNTGGNFNRFIRREY